MTPTCTLTDRKVDEQVGVGDGDMGALTQLDSDRARLSSGHKQAVRDIVQFIRKYQRIYNSQNWIHKSFCFKSDRLKLNAASATYRNGRWKDDMT